MDKNSIIDKESFEVCTNAEDHPKVFVCDKLIAPTVALLNKKGYKTFASCSGHYKIEFYEYLNEDIKNLDEYQKYNDPRTHIWSEISFYDENNEHRKRSDIQNEIEDKCNRLKEWAECLPNIN